MRKALLLAAAAVTLSACSAAPSSTPSTLPDAFPPAFVSQSELMPGEFRVSITDSRGRDYPTSGKSYLVERTGEVITPIPQLLAGDYTVRYEGADGNLVEQHFSVGGRSMIPEYPESPARPSTATITVLLGTAMLFSVLAYRRRRIVLIAPGIFAIAVVVLLASEDPEPEGDRPALSCGAEAAGENFELLRQCLVRQGTTFVPFGVDAVGLFLQAIEAEPILAAWEGQHICHEVAHDLGKIVAYESENLVDQLSEMPEICRLGLIHGAMEAAGILLNDEELLRTSRTV